MDKSIKREHGVETNLSIGRPRLDGDLLKDLSEPAPGRLLIQTCMEWFWIAGLIAAASRLSNAALDLFCMVAIATRQHALLALMHEYSHCQFSRKHAWLNDLIGDVLTAFPFFITIHGFRRNHLPHHRQGWSDTDRNWLSNLKQDRFRFPKTRTQLLAEILKHGTGWYALSDLKAYALDAGMAVNLPRLVRTSRAFCAIGFVIAVTWLQLWWTVLLYWLVPLATFLMAILYLRDVGEHFGMPAPGIAGSRTVVAGWVERVLFCQHGVNFHTEHHLFPRVPFFRLGQLHRILMNDDRYRRHAVVTRGYLSGLVGEVTRGSSCRRSAAFKTESSTAS